MVKVLVSNSYFLLDIDYFLLGHGCPRLTNPFATEQSIPELSLEYPWKCF